MKKVLLTAGCSFSEPGSEWGNTWPDYLAKNYKHHIGLGKGGVGNGYISRAVIHEVNRVKPDVVGIMWSAWNRVDLRIEELGIKNTQARDTYNKFKAKSWPNYPVHWNDLESFMQHEIEENLPRLKLLLQDPIYYLRRGFTEKEKYWTNIENLLDNPQYADSYFTLFNDNISTQIYSLEHILRTQWYLESKGIPYFMMAMNDAVTDLTKTPETTHLINMLGEIMNPSLWAWTMKNYGTDGFVNYPTDQHPKTLQHKKYTEQVILPYLESKCLI